MLHIKTFMFNLLGENCYLLWDDLGEAAIIDCGAHSEAEKEELAQYIEEHKLRPKLHLLTHGHFDHTFGAQFLYRHYGLRPHVHEADKPIYPFGKEMANVFLHRDFPMDELPEAEYFTEDTTFELGTYKLRPILTPGHTPGGVCYYCESEGILLSGDNLFNGSIGRCDFPLGNEDELIGALKTKILTLPENTKVFPGHGSPTSIEWEKENNFYLR